MDASLWVMFALWLVYGLVQWRRSSRWLEASIQISSARRATEATLWLIGGAVGLLSVLGGLFALGAFPEGRIVGWAWPICAAAGLGFVHSQLVAGTLLLAGAVTGSGSKPSHSTKEGNPS